MRRLLIIRHAKSSWKDASLPDHDRPLNKRGRRDAPLMAERLYRRGMAVDCLLVSSAERVRATAAVLADTLGVTDLRIDDDLYLADAEEILYSIGGIEPAVACLAVVGHNPGITELVNDLAGSLTDNVPTLGLACFRVTGDWEAVSAETVELEFYDFPKNDPDPEL